MQPLNEYILHYIWKFRLFQQLDLKSTDGIPVHVILPGEQNVNAGPDFLMAKIHYQQHLWVGSVEVHLKSSDWIIHQHQHDVNYQNVVLHVVWEHDYEITLNDGFTIPVLELKNYVDPGKLALIHHWMQNAHFIPCQVQFEKLDSFVVDIALTSMLVERIWAKAEILLEELKSAGENWEKVAYLSLFKSFGLHVNTPAFEDLARHIDPLIIQKYRQDQLKIEAVLFGIANLLDGKNDDDYVRELQKEFRYLAKLHHFPTVFTPWKMLRMRPHNFPYLKIAQLAQLISGQQNLFSFFIEMNDSQSFQKTISEITLAPYWDRHFQFGKESKQVTVKKLSKETAASLLINTVLPLQFAYASYMAQEDLKEKALQFFERIKPENNKIIRGFAKIGFKAKHAGHSQALLHLKHQYCDKKKCLSCPIGYQLIKTPN